MKYDLEIEITPKNPQVAMIFRVEEAVAREFKDVAKKTGVPMTQIIRKILQEFINEHRNRGLPRDRKIS